MAKQKNQITYFQMWKVGRLYKDLKAGDLRYSLATHTHLTREYTHLPRGSKDIPNSGRKEIMQFHLPTDTEEKPKLTFLIKHALKELCHEIQPN